MNSQTSKKIKQYLAAFIVASAVMLADSYHTILSYDRMVEESELRMLETKIDYLLKL